MTAVAVGVSLSDVYGSFTRMVQTLDFTTIRRAPKEYHWYCDNARTGKHISLTECFVISAYVDSREDTQTYGLCSALLDRSIRAGIFYGTVTPPSTFAEQRLDLLLWGTTHWGRITTISGGRKCAVVVKLSRRTNSHSSSARGKSHI